MTSDATELAGKLRCIFCDFTGDSLAELRVHSSECKKHPLMIACNAYRRFLDEATAMLRESPKRDSDPFSADRIIWNEKRVAFLTSSPAAQGSTEAATPSPATTAGPMTGEQLRCWMYDKMGSTLFATDEIGWEEMTDLLARTIWPARQPADGRREELRRERTYSVRVFIWNDDGGYCVATPDLPGCMSEAATFEKAIENIREAFIGVALTYADNGIEIPFTPLESRVDRPMFHEERHLSITVTHQPESTHER
jgi:predicted RNase H-like HicB family nuclease